MKDKTAIIILAAGESSRMGKPKQLLLWKNKTLIENIIQQALLVQKSAVFVVLGANYELINERIKHYPVTTIEHKNWKNGMGSSIAYGVNEIKKNQDFNSVLITLADQPFLTNNTFNILLQKFKDSKRKIIVSKFKDSFGVPAVFHNSCFDVLLNLKGDVGAKKLLNQNKTLVEVCEIQEIFKDIDTLEDYKECLNLLSY